MKTKFSSFDVACIVAELKKKIEGLRVVNVYDIDSKSYMIKLGQDVKTMLYIESGCRIHTTAFEWPKQMMPSAFSAKCRKVMKNKRLTSISQVGCDRIIDLQFGFNEHTSHLMIELYDRGNVCLCDQQYIITAILRTRHDKKEEIRYAIGHYYPLDVCQKLVPPCIEFIRGNIKDIKPNTQLKRWLNFLYPLSTTLIEHHLIKAGLEPDKQLTEESVLESINNIYHAISCSYNSFNSLPSTIEKGYIIFKNMKSSLSAQIMDEFHPFKFHQLEDLKVNEYSSYNESIDVYFYEQEAQKIEMKSLQQEKNVMKKLENIKSDHENRIKALQNVQEASTKKAYLIEINLDLVNEAISTVQNLIANRLSWEEIEELINEGKENDHKAALAIKNVNLESNRMIMSLKDHYHESTEFFDIEIDLDMGAYCNAKIYFDQVKQSSLKEKRTIQSSTVALKNAEKVTDATINDINIVASIKKARKLLWFEKFLWFITSDGFTVIGGRDAQQNEIIVKKYLKKNDVYVHADIHGATSIIIKNKADGPMPPKALMEAGCFALCHSSAWNSKIVTSAYWVHAEQVSKTAPTGEYLTTGSFMIRGKKNYLPPTQLILGFSILFKIDEESVQRRLLKEKEKNSDNKSSTPLQEEDGCEIESHDENVKNFDRPNSEKYKTVNEDVMDNLFEKYNLQISAVQRNEQDYKTTEFTDLVGTACKPRLRKHLRNTNSDGKISEARQSNKPKRGQKGKKKKLEKYADQSDEEREAMMALLGSSGAKKEKAKSSTTNSKLKYKPESTAKNVVSQITDTGDTKVKEADRVIMTLSKTLDENTCELAENAELTIEKSKTQKTDSESIQDLKSFNADQDTSDNEDVPCDILDSLVLNPSTEDSILFGIPFVAPYSATSSCKFRVKLLPGITKKGKACKTILDLFSKDRNALIQEKNVFKSLKDVDMTTNIPGKVKISAPNLYGHSKK